MRRRAEGRRRKGEKISASPPPLFDFLKEGSDFFFFFIKNCYRCRRFYYQFNSNSGILKLLKNVRIIIVL